jgi:hypothetical protein
VFLTNFGDKKKASVCAKDTKSFFGKTNSPKSPHYEDLFFEIAIFKQ